MEDRHNSLEHALLAAARVPSAPIPCPAERPDLAGAYAIQQRANAASCLPVMVWKIGLTGPGGREALGAREPIVGRLAASAIYCDRSEIDFSGKEMFAEAELVFEMGADLPEQDAPYTRADLCAALKGIYAGIEICRTRFATSDLPLELLVADNAMGHGLVLGRKLADTWDDRFAAMPVTLTRNAEAPVEGSTAMVLDNPLDALIWLANWLRKHEGRSLTREQLVASGSCTGVTDIFPRDTISVNFNGAEGARVTLTAKDWKE
ncbi:2-keto-4-pentenoate hydratase [Sphingobium sp. OAS761]|uniref:2-keto-4-pentenoate hydratase n=1 Tax=Sphingobium sp. OAS761 TaxID=2817901 RepID=UPI0020A03DA9|nr:hypothetical protein [Sphingobium sp. OAS761]MCP1471626.1 2-keto-4-pentenoate hydratase [Sphingobium sp. OAS761]